MSLSDYHLHSQLYTNPSAGVTIYAATHLPSSTEVVIKEQLQADLEGANLVIKEAMVQARLVHRYICRVFDCFLAPGESGRLKAIIVVEKLTGDLGGEISRRKERGEYWSEREVLVYLKMLCEACSFAQTNNVAHRDIKPPNVFLSSDGTMKLGDFGSSKANLYNQTAVSTTLQGSPFYLSPELKLGFVNSMMTGSMEVAGYDPFKSDVYSLGLTILHMALLEAPTQLMNLGELENSTREVLEGIAGWQYVQYVVGCMLAVRPEERVGFADVVQYLDGVLSPVEVQVWDYREEERAEGGIVSGEVLDSLLDSLEKDRLEEDREEQRMEETPPTATETHDFDELVKRIENLERSGSGGTESIPEKHCINCSKPILNRSWQRAVTEEYQTYRVRWDDLCSVACLRSITTELESLPATPPKATDQPPLSPVPPQSADDSAGLPKTEQSPCLHCRRNNPLSVKLQCGHGFDCDSCTARFVIQASNKKSDTNSIKCPLCEAYINLPSLVEKSGGPDAMWTSLQRIANNKVCCKCRKHAEIQTPSGKYICEYCVSQDLRKLKKK